MYIIQKLEGVVSRPARRVQRFSVRDLYLDDNDCVYFATTKQRSVLGRVKKSVLYYSGECAFEFKERVARAHGTHFDGFNVFHHLSFINYLS